MHSWLPSPSQHFMWIAIALLVYIVSTRVGQVRRPPASAIAWVIGLVLLPYLWLPLFVLFGQRKLRPRYRPPAALSRAESHWAMALIESFGLPPPVASDARFHTDGERAREALWETIACARRRLDVCTFLVADDVLGRELIERLTQRAQAGIQVRLMIDGAGIWLARHPSFRALRQAGGQVALFHPLFGVRQHGPRNLRNHRKFVLADDARLWSGGRNFAAEYFCGDSTRTVPWIDLSFDLTGALAAAAARQFEMDWTHAHGVRPARVPDALLAAVDAPRAQFLPSGPDQPEDTAQTLLVAACFRAQRRLLAVTPYFVPDESLLSAMRLAARRGVRVTLVLPAVSNHRLADFARGRALRVLAEAGVDIRLVLRMVHAKAVVVDDDLAMCGSVNLDARSLLINYESAVVFYGVTEIAWLAGWIDALATQGVPFEPRAASLWRDLAEGLILTMAFQL